MHSQEEFKPDAWPFTAVGKLNVLTGPTRVRYCTATLIEKRYVLTAAHCLFDGPTQKWVDASAVHFVAGYNQGAYVAHSVGKSYIKSDKFDPEGPASRLYYDWAIIELEKDIAIKPIRVRTPGNGSVDVKMFDNVTRAGYRRDRNQIMTVKRNRHATIEGRDNLTIKSDCGAYTGESGSALLYNLGSELA